MPFLRRHAFAGRHVPDLEPAKRRRPADLSVLSIIVRLVEEHRAGRPTEAEADALADGLSSALAVLSSAGIGFQSYVGSNSTI